MCIVSHAVVAPIFFDSEFLLGDVSLTSRANQKFLLALEYVFGDVPFVSRATKLFVSVSNILSVM